MSASGQSRRSAVRLTTSRRPDSRHSHQAAAPKKGPADYGSIADSCPLWVARRKASRLKRYDTPNQLRFKPLITDGENWQIAE